MRREAAERERQWRLSQVAAVLDRLAADVGAAAAIATWLKDAGSSLPKPVAALVAAGLAYVKPYAR